MIHPSGTFEYESEFTSDSFRDSDIVLQGTCTNSMDIDRLIGHHPTIRFWDDRVILFASEKSHASLRNFSFTIGDAVSLSARPRDRLYLVRTGCGGIGLSLLREKRLVLAIGAVTAVPLGTNINVTPRPKRQNFFEGRLEHTWLEFTIDSETLELRNRELKTIGDYQIYVEHSWEDGIPGTNECVSVYRASDPALNLAALRSAMLLGHSRMKMTKWDGTEMFA